MARKQGEKREADDVVEIIDDDQEFEEDPMAEDEIVSTFRAGVERFIVRAESEEALTEEECSALDVVEDLSRKITFGFSNLGENEAFGRPVTLSDEEYAARNQLKSLVGSFVTLLRGTHEMALTGGRRMRVPNLESNTLRRKIAREGRGILVFLSEIAAKRSALEDKYGRSYELRLSTLQAYLAIRDARLVIEAYLMISASPMYQGGIGMKFHLKRVLIQLGRFNKLRPLITQSVVADYEELRRRGLVA